MANVNERSKRDISWNLRNTLLGPEDRDRMLDGLCEKRDIKEKEHMLLKEE